MSVTESTSGGGGRLLPAREWDITEPRPGATNPRGRDPRTVEPPPSGDNIARVDKMYASTNLMCYLLEGVPYNDLYGPNARTVVELLSNPFRSRIQAIQNDQKYFSQDEQDECLPGKIIDRIDELISDLDNSDVTFRNVYTNHKQDPNRPEGKVKQHLERIRHWKGTFCFPFLDEDVDLADTNNRVDKLLRCVGDFDMYQLFTHSRKRLRIDATCDRKDLLDAPQSSSGGGITVMTSFDCENSNYSRCTSQGCDNSGNPNAYCNEDEWGDCSALSGECT